MPVCAGLLLGSIWFLHWQYRASSPETLRRTSMLRNLVMGAAALTMMTGAAVAQTGYSSTTTTVTPGATVPYTAPAPVYTVPAPVAPAPTVTYVEPARREAEPARRDAPGNVAAYRKRSGAWCRHRMPCHASDRLCSRCRGWGSNRWRHGGRCRRGRVNTSEGTAAITLTEDYPGSVVALVTRHDALVVGPEHHIGKAPRRIDYQQSATADRLRLHLAASRPAIGSGRGRGSLEERYSQATIKLQSGLPRVK